MYKLRLMARLISLLLYGLSLIIFHRAEPIAAKVYNDLCSSQGIRFHDAEPLNFLISEFAIIGIPILLARSNVLVLLNLFASLPTSLSAWSLLNTAAKTPYECFTQDGWYEDRTSGLDDFDWGFGFVILLSYLFLIVDLTAWSIEKIIAYRKREAAKEHST